MALFDRVAGLHQRLVLAPLWEDRFEGHGDDPWAAAALFLYGYGIGAPRDGGRRRAGAGAAALERAGRRGPYRTAGDAAEAAWGLLTDLPGSSPGNARLHPLYPSSDPADLDLRPRPSLLEIRYVGDVAGHQASLTDFSASLLGQGDASTVIDLLLEVRGVTEVRARRFLRDLALWKELETRDEPRVLPRDRPVRAAAAALGGENAGVGDVPGWLADRCRRRSLDPKRVSAGLSYFAAAIAGDVYRLRACLDDLSLARRLERRHRARLAETV